MGLFHKIITAFTPSNDLKRRVGADPFVRTMVISLNDAFGSTDLVSHNPETKFIAELDEPTREGMLKHLLDKVEKIADSPNRALACRKWLVEEAQSYAPVRALFTSARAYEDEVAAGTRHVLNLGIFEHAEEIVEVLFAERVTTQGSVAQVLRSLRLESMWAHYRMNFANLGRFAIGDEPSQSQPDWLQPYFQGLVADAELSIRVQITQGDDTQLQELRASLERERYLILNSAPRNRT